MKQAIPRCERMTHAACVEHFDHMDCQTAHSFCSSELIEPYEALGLSRYDITKRCLGDDCDPEQKWIEEYLNQPWVQHVLGIDSSFGNFTLYAPEVGYAFGTSGDLLHQNQLYVAELLHRGVKFLIYVGANDFICNWVGNERWTLNMEWIGHEEYASLPLRDWFVGNNMVGKTRSAQNLTFATILGAGHLLPHDKPVESLQMVKRWLAGQDL